MIWLNEDASPVPASASASEMQFLAPSCGWTITLQPHKLYTHHTLKVRPTPHGRLRFADEL